MNCIISDKLPCLCEMPYQSTGTSSGGVKFITSDVTFQVQNLLPGVFQVQFNSGVGWLLLYLIYLVTRYVWEPKLNPLLGKVVLRGIAWFCMLLDLSGTQVCQSWSLLNFAGCTLFDGCPVEWNNAQFTKFSPKKMDSHILAEESLTPPVSWLHSQVLMYQCTYVWMRLCLGGKM